MQFLAALPQSELDDLTLFKFDFGENQQSFAVSNDMKTVFRLTQMNGLESSTNSYFLDDQVISDGKMVGMVPFLPGWFFLSLYTRSKTARSVFITVEDVITEFEEQNGPNFGVVSKIFEANQSLITLFLGQFMPSQENYEKIVGFRFDEDRVIAYLVKMIQSVADDENIDTSELTSNSYYAAKWSSHLAIHARSIMLVESLSSHLPASLIHSILKELNLTPCDDLEIKKLLKPSDTLVKQIPSGSSLKNADSIAPTEDYSQFNSKKNKQATAAAVSRQKGQSSISSFFKN